MASIEELDIALANGAHRHGQCLRPGWRQQQVDVIVHQDKGVHGDGILGASFAEQSPVVMTILVVDENGRTVDTALGDVEQDLWKNQSCATRHDLEGLDGQGVSNVSPIQIMRKKEMPEKRVGNFRLIPSVPFRSL